MLEKKYRLPPFNIKKVYRRGDTLKGETLIIKALESFRQNSRCAFVVSARTIKKATERNLIKRRISEIVRPLIEEIEPKKDLIFIVKKEADFGELKKEIKRLLNV